MEEIKFTSETFYGSNAIRPHFTVSYECEKQTFLETILQVFREFVYPAMLFALAFTFLKYAMLGHF